MLNETRRLHDTDHAFDIGSIWTGAREDPFATATITGTAALALWTLKAAPTLEEATTLATELWHHRQPQSRRTG
jgi:anthranilate phosphoribosyltransferase